MVNGGLLKVEEKAIVTGRVMAEESGFNVSFEGLQEAISKMGLLARGSRPGSIARSETSH